MHLEIPELPPKRYYYTSQDAYMQEYEPRSLLRRRLDMLFLESCTDPSFRMDRGKVEVKYIFHIRENTIRDVDGFDIKVIQDVITEYLLTDDNYKLVSVSLEGQEIKNPNIDTCLLYTSTGSLIISSVEGNPNSLRISSKFLVCLLYTSRCV